MLAAAGALLFFRRRPPQNPIYPTRKRRTKKARHRFLIHCRDAPCGYPGFSIQTGTGYPRGVPYDGKNYGFVGAGLASALIGTATQRRAPARGAPTCFYRQGHPRGVPYDEKNLWFCRGGPCVRPYWNCHPKAGTREGCPYMFLPSRAPARGAPTSSIFRSVAAACVPWDFLDPCPISADYQLYTAEYGSSRRHYE